MAYRASDDNNVVIVVKGDCLWSIAQEFLGKGSLYPQLKKLNNLTSNVIYAGQRLRIAGSSTDDSPTSSTTVNTNCANITHFGIMASSSVDTIYAVWTWGKSDNTEKYEYEWEYRVTDVEGEVWWSGEKQDTEETESSWTIPDNAVLVRFRVKPISKLKPKKNYDDPDEYYFTANWSDYKYHYAKDNPPGVPSAPSVRIDEHDPYKFIAELSGIDADALNASHIEFWAIRFNAKDNTTTGGPRSGKIPIDAESNYVSFTNNLAPLVAGGEYRVKCRSWNANGVSGDWSAYSNTINTPPPKSSGFTVCKVKSKSVDGNISVYLEWNPVDGATGYDIEYAEKIEYFDTTDRVSTLVTGYDKTQYETFGLYDGTNGGVYYLRLRSSIGDLKSDWSEPSRIELGEKPEAPTTWSSTTVAGVNSPLTLYWIHNSKDGSDETYAQLSLEIYVSNGANYDLKWSIEREIAKPTNVESDPMSFFDATTYLAQAAPAYYKDGIQLRWRVRTAGVTREFGDWSVVRTVDIYANPAIILEIRDGSNTINSTLDTLGSFPIYISATTSPKTQAPIGFYVTITANESYDTVDNVGNNKTVNVGDSVYAKYFDRNTDLDDLVLSAGDVDLESGIKYTLTCTAAMNSGLTAETSVDFTVRWEDVSYTPNASIEYDPSMYITRLRPYCNLRTDTYYNVNYVSGKYTATNTTINPAPLVPMKKQYASNGKEIYTEYLAETDMYRYYYLASDGTQVEVSKSAIVKSVPVLTTTGEQVYSGLTDVTIDSGGNVTGGEEMFFCVRSTETPVEGVRLAVYRREFDGSFTELATNIDNTKNTYVTDPHPALDYARYRIVATTESTGAVSYYDMPGYPIQEKAVLIQWDEAWSNFDVASDDPRSQPPWTGSLLRLPYNVDVTDSFNMDVSHVEYVGRKRPVSYYGTQLGESSTWNVEIEKKDEETLYAIRRLAIWTGDAYVREPSGTGYWATVTPSFSQKHKELTIPVTFTIKRVEGGA